MTVAIVVLLGESKSPRTRVPRTSKVDTHRSCANRSTKIVRGKDDFFFTTNAVFSPSYPHGDSTFCGSANRGGVQGVTGETEVLILVVVAGRFTDAGVLVDVGEVLTAGAPVAGGVPVAVTGVVGAPGAGAVPGTAGVAGGVPGAGAIPGCSGTSPGGGGNAGSYKDGSNGFSRSVIVPNRSMFTHCPPGVTYAPTSLSYLGKTCSDRKSVV